MRRACLYLGAALPFLILALWYGLVWSAHDPVREKFKLVQPGWTRADVERVMGEPTWFKRFDGDTGEMGLQFRGIDGVGWVTIVEDTGVVTEVQWHEWERLPLWVRLCDQLGIPRPAQPGEF